MKKKSIVYVLAVALIVSAFFGFASLEGNVNLTSETDTDSVFLSVDVSNEGSSAVDEVRLYVPALDNVQCSDKSGWQLYQLDDFPDSEFGTVTLCWYFTDNSLGAASEVFQFSADRPGYDLVDVKVELREDALKNGDLIAFNKQIDIAAEPVVEEEPAPIEATDETGGVE